MKKVYKKITEAVEELGTDYPKKYPEYKEQVNPVPQEVMPTSFVSAVRDTNKNMKRADELINKRRKDALEIVSHKSEDRFKHMTKKEADFNQGKKITLDESLFVESKFQIKEDDEEDSEYITDIEEFKPWNGAADNYKKIKDANKLPQFYNVIKSLYPDKIKKQALNDLLWYDFDFIKSELGMEE